MPESNVGGGGVFVVPGTTQTTYPQWTGWYYATVSNNADPMGIGRCQLRIPQVLGTTVSTWAWALTVLSSTTSSAAASTTPPPVGTVVAVMFIGGDLSNPAYLLLTTSATTVTTPVTTGTGTGGGSGTTPSATTTSLPNGTVGTAYSQAVTVSGGTGPYTYTVTSGSLPSWATLNASTGVISGTPTANGTSTFTITITDASGATVDTEALTLTVGAYVVAVTTMVLPTAQVGQAFTATMAATGGTGTYTWAVSAGALPAGLTLTSSTGVVAGTPTAPGTGSVTMQATDTDGNSATQVITTTVISGPVGSPPGGPWQLAFADEFNVPYVTPYGTGPDPNVWSDHMINGDLFRTNDDGEVQWYPHGYYAHSIANSILTLTGTWQSPQSVDPTCPSGEMIPGDSGSNPGTATSGMIASYLGYNFTYGYVEIYMQHPTAASPGPWPQMAMYTRDNDWPPEIDIDEYNAPGHANDTHNGYLNTADSYQSGYFSPGTGYHTWGMALLPGTVTFYFDGTQSFQATYDGDAYPWFLIYTLGIQIGSSSSGFPYSVGIDYIRAWVIDGVPDPPSITAISPSNGVASGGDVTVTFNASSGATSYRVTASPTDAMADGYGGSDVTDTSRFTATGSSSPLTVTGLPSNVRFNFTVCAINATGYSAESDPAGPQIVNIQMITPVLPTATTGTAYTATLEAQAGNPPYTWAVTEGSLPAGLTLDATTGVISGTPTGSGSVFTVTVSGDTSWSGGTTVANSASQSLTITVAGTTTTGSGSTSGGGGTTSGGTTGTFYPSWDPNNTGNWTMAFDDEFSNDTSLNTTWWGAGWQGKSGTTSKINSNESVSGYDSSNVTFTSEGVNLSLTSNYGACITTNTNGTGGSEGFALNMPCAAEAYIYMPVDDLSPDGIDNWPAFWLDGQSWPADGEIDIVEGLNDYAAYHVHDSANSGGIGANAGSPTSYVGWHKFGMSWANNTVTFYYDGVSVGSEPTSGFTGPMYLIFDYTYAGTASSYDLSLVMIVAWVRVWTPG